MCECGASRARKPSPRLVTAESKSRHTKDIGQKASSPQRRRPALGARHALVSSWLLSRPFTPSFIEDAESGTSRVTRANTMLNRQSPLSTKQDPAEDSSPTTSSAGSDTSGHSEPPSDPPADRQPVRFADHASVFAPGEPPTLERIRWSSNQSGLFKKSVNSSRPSDPYQPTSTGGRWLLRKMSQ